MLRDPFGRVVDYLRVSVTDRCDLRCVYCMPPEGIPLKPVSEILTYDELIRTVRVAVSLGVRKVRITGGEPLVRRGIVPFVRRVAGSRVRDLGMTTNGTALPEMAAALREAAFPASTSASTRSGATGTPRSPAGTPFRKSSKGSGPPSARDSPR